MCPECNGIDVQTWYSVVKGGCTMTCKDCGREAFAEGENPGDSVESCSERFLSLRELPSNSLVAKHEAEVGGLLGTIDIQLGLLEKSRELFDCLLGAVEDGDDYQSVKAQIKEIDEHIRKERYLDGKGQK